jgi:hypothetical protein
MTLSETVRFEVEIPKGHYDAISFLCDMDPRDSLDAYMTRTIKGDIESLLECPEYVADFIMYKFEQMIKG